MEKKKKKKKHIWKTQQQCLFVEILTVAARSVIPKVAIVNFLN